MAAATGAGSVSEGMRRLTQLLLVSKVCSELESHLGVDDRVLAEFIIDLGRASASAAAFATALRDHGAELPDYLVRSLHAVITAIPHSYPAPPAASRGAGAGTGARGRRVDRAAGEDDDQEPELHQVRRGRVTRVADAGCFVRLGGGREGLVHVSVDGAKLGLSMRDVDQDTGPLATAMDPLLLPSSLLPRYASSIWRFSSERAQAQPGLFRAQS